MTLKMVIMVSNGEGMNILGENFWRKLFDDSADVGDI